MNCFPGIEMDDPLKPKEAARLLGMSVPWIYKAAKAGLLPCIEYPGLGEKGTNPVRFKREDLIQFREDHYKKGVDHGNHQGTK